MFRGLICISQDELKDISYSTAHRVLTLPHAVCKCA